MHFTRYEQETIVNYNAGEDTATIYTRNPTVMRKIDVLVNAFPAVYKLIKATEYDRIYEVPKSYISYRKPRKISDEQRKRARERIKNINNT